MNTTQYGILNNGDFQMRRETKTDNGWTFETFTVRETGEAVARDLVARCKADPALRERWFELLRAHGHDRGHHPGMSCTAFLLAVGLDLEPDPERTARVAAVVADELADAELEPLAPETIEPNPSRVPASAFCDGCGRRLQLGHRAGCRSELGEPVERRVGSVSNAELARAAETAHDVFPGAAGSALAWFAVLQQLRGRIAAMVAPVVTKVRGSVALLEAADAPAGELVVQL